MRTLGLFGSGEFMPWAEPVDRLLIERSAVGTGKVALLPLASAPEGDGVFEQWSAMGLEHYRRLGADPFVIPIKTRADAMQPEHAEALEDVSLVFFSGGNPGFAATALAGTPFWEALSGKIDAGVSFGGCSAGAVMLGDSAPDIKPDLTFEWVDGLRLLPGCLIGAHWDMLDSYRPGLREELAALIPDGCLLVGVDEDTALVGDGVRYEVHGRGTAEVLPPGKRFAPGDTLDMEEMR